MDGLFLPLIPVEVFSCLSHGTPCNGISLVCHPTSEGNVAVTRAPRNLSKAAHFAELPHVHVTMGCTFRDPKEPSPPVPFRF